MPSRLNKTIRLTTADKALSVPMIVGRNVLKDNTIYCGDAARALKLFPPHYFNLIVADPPYNNGVDFGNDSDKQDEDQYRRWVQEWILLLPNIMTESGSVYICCDWIHSGFFQEAIQASGLHIINRITWKREKGRGAKRNWKQNMEDIWFAVRDQTNYTFNIDRVKIKKNVIAPYRENGNPKDWYLNDDGDAERLTHPSNIWTDLTVPFWSMPENTEHPTQKPETMIERIVEASSNKSDRILDLFSGSGTSSVIAKRLGRKFIGIELNPDFVRLGRKRLSKESSGRIRK